MRRAGEAAAGDHGGRATRSAVRSGLCCRRQSWPRRAERYLDELLDRCERVVDFPFAAPANLRNRKDWRAIPYGPFIIFYSVSDRLVRIRAVKHAASLK
ncbi:MAG: type II toxin-antitoxin system RelE/ParE family toxin [Gemmatimonadaceae bacterium]|nr:type II toxin-antitoxin system RelE/ParE family toxin [Caulobacter sp.]